MFHKINLNLFSKHRTEIMGLSILWVMFFHSTIDCSGIPVIKTIKQYGNVGVDIFLLLSGIGCYYSMARISQEQLGKTRCFIGFYKARVVRILPATIILLMPWYMYLYQVQEREFRILRFLGDISSLSYWMDGKNRGWYVALTIVLYGIYPLIYYIIIKKNQFWCLFSIIVVIALNCLLVLIFPGWFANVELALGRIPIFLFGCFIAPYVKEGKELPGLIVYIALLICLISPSYIKWLRELTDDAFFLFRYALGIMGGCTAIVFAVVLDHIPGIRNWILLVFSFFGNYTLEIYLSHTQIQTVLQEQHLYHSEVAISIVSAFLSIIIAVIVHELLRSLLQKKKSNRK